MNSESKDKLSILKDALEDYKYGIWDNKLLVWLRRKQNVMFILNILHKKLDPKSELSWHVNSKLLQYRYCTECKLKFRSRYSHHNRVNTYGIHYANRDLVKMLADNDRLNWIENTLFKLSKDGIYNLNYMHIINRSWFIPIKTTMLTYDEKTGFVKSTNRTRDTLCIFRANIHITDDDIREYNTNTVDEYLMDILGSHENYSLFMKMMSSIHYDNMKRNALFIKASPNIRRIISKIICQLYDIFVDIRNASKSKTAKTTNVVKCVKIYYVDRPKALCTNYNIMWARYIGHIPVFVMGDYVQSSYMMRSIHRSKPELFMTIPDNNSSNDIDEIPHTTLVKIILDVTSCKYLTADEIKYVTACRVLNKDKFIV